MMSFYFNQSSIYHNVDSDKARSNILMVINLRQNKNDESTAYGKYFPEVDSKEALNLKGLAKHMTEHGKI